MRYFKSYPQLVRTLLLLQVALCSATPNDFPDARWPTLESHPFNEIELAVRESLFDRTHFVIESSCQLTPFEHPTAFLDSQVTARWAQSLLLEVEPLTKRHGFTIDTGIGYSLERSTISCCYGEISSHYIEPALILPFTITYSRPSRAGNLQSYVQLEWEMTPYLFSRTTTLFHRIIVMNRAESCSSFTLYGREKAGAHSLLDTDFAYKHHQIGFVLEHSAY